MLFDHDDISLSTMQCIEESLQGSTFPTLYLSFQYLYGYYVDIDKEKSFTILREKVDDSNTIILAKFCTILDQYFHLNNYYTNKALDNKSIFGSFLMKENYKGKKIDYISHKKIDFDFFKNFILPFFNEKLHKLCILRKYGFNADFGDPNFFPKYDQFKKKLANNVITEIIKNDSRKMIMMNLSLTQKNYEYISYLSQISLNIVKNENKLFLFCLVYDAFIIYGNHFFSYAIKLANDPTSLKEIIDNFIYLRMHAI